MQISGHYSLLLIEATRNSAIRKFHLCPQDRIKFLAPHHYPASSHPFLADLPRSHSVCQDVLVPILDDSATLVILSKDRFHHSPSIDIRNILSLASGTYSRVELGPFLIITYLLWCDKQCLSHPNHLATRFRHANSFLYDERFNPMSSRITGCFPPSIVGPIAFIEVTA
jgi:hypothetical protein